MTPIEQGSPPPLVARPAGGSIMARARHPPRAGPVPAGVADHGWSREAFGAFLALQNLISVAQPFTGMVADRFGSLRVIVAGMLPDAAVTMAHAATTGMFTVGAASIAAVASAFASIYGALSRLFPPDRAVGRSASWARSAASASSAWCPSRRR